MGCESKAEKREWSDANLTQKWPTDRSGRRLVAVQISKVAKLFKISFFGFRKFFQEGFVRFEKFFTNLQSSFLVWQRI